MSIISHKSLYQCLHRIESYVSGFIALYPGILSQTIATDIQAGFFFSVNSTKFFLDRF